jgi:hypothetical protein
MILLKCCSVQKLDEPPQDAGPFGWVSETLEIGIGIVCSTITWRFTVQSESSYESESVRANSLETVFELLC